MLFGIVGLALALSGTYISDAEYLSYVNNDEQPPYPSGNQKQFNLVFGAVFVVVGSFLCCFQLQRKPYLSRM